MAERTCLIVDDSKIVRKVMRKIIEPLGFAILEAEDGQQALDACDQDEIELVMLDWNMPVMNGMEFLLALRARTDLAQPMVVFCTTENEFTKIQEALMNGANEYVMKPFDEEIIRGKLEQLGLI
jgi:two-component system, chemotaxis family, chemotaxis protein CheY